MKWRLSLARGSVALVGLVACQDLGPGGEPVDLSYAPCVGAIDNPTWFAFQDGDGAWQRVMASSSGAFNFTVSSGKAGIAMFSTSGLFVLYATADELKANFPTCGGGAVRTVTGSVSGYSSADDINLVIGTSSDVVAGTQAPPAAFALTTVDATASDLVAVRFRQSSFEAFPDRVLLRRNVTGTTTPTVDFANTAETTPALNRTLKVTSLAAGEALSVLSYIGLASTTANIAVYDASAALSSGEASAPFYGVSGARLTAGETQMIVVTAARTVSSITHDSRFMTSVFNDPTDRSMTLGPSLGVVTVTGTSRPSASYNVQGAYDNLYDAVFIQGFGANRRQVEVLATNSYLGGATSVALSVPDLSALAGFSSTWLLVPGVSSSWAFLATDADLSILNGKVTTYQGADRASVFTP